MSYHKNSTTTMKGNYLSWKLFRLNQIWFKFVSLVTILIKTYKVFQLWITWKIFCFSFWTLYFWEFDGSRGNNLIDDVMLRSLSFPFYHKILIKHFTHRLHYLVDVKMPTEGYINNLQNCNKTVIHWTRF